MKNRIHKKLLALLLTGIMIFSITACGDYEVEESKTQDLVETSEEGTQEDLQADSDAQWVIYWYLCGSDLESSWGAATDDLAELCEVQLPENVTFIIQTGGTSLWQNDIISAEYLERYIYDSNGLQLIEQQPLASMGSTETLSDFLTFANENYPADKTGFIFWNHGGGSVTGAASDENFGGDALTLDEMYTAFGENYELSLDYPPFEFIGFDTCLMATVDVAYTYCDIAKYLIASQETEPSSGWLYSAWPDALGQNPGMETSELGKIICDTYVEGCELIGAADDITLSVTDLSLIPELVATYDDFGKEALANACVDSSFVSEFGRIAVATENYGGNTKEQGFTNMADLGHLARKAAEILPETSEAVLASLDSCVEYKVNGPYREEASGLSCYYSYNSDIDDFNSYVNVGVSEAFKYFYSYALTSELTDEGYQYIADMNYESMPVLETLADQGWDNHLLEVDSEGAATLTLGEKAADVLSGIYIQLYYADPEQDLLLLLGSDNDLIADWENGIFKDNFRGVWGAIDGNLVYMELSYEGEGYNLYNVPILLNGEEYNLSVVYDFETATYGILGAKRAIDENGMADKNLRYLTEGDVITTIHYMMPISGEDEYLTPVEVDEITVTADIAFTEVDLGDGMFIQLFEMQDMQGNIAYSDTAVFEIANGEITTSTGYTEE